MQDCETSAFCVVLWTIFDNSVVYASFVLSADKVGVDEIGVCTNGICGVDYCYIDFVMLLCVYSALYKIYSIFYSTERFDKIRSNTILKSSFCDVVFGVFVG